MQQRSRFLTFFLSFIPGVGHLYLGLMIRGVSFLVGFFGWIVFVAFLSVASRQDGFQVLLLALPILWFYSFFDALHQRRRMAEGEHVPDISPITELTQGTETGKRSKVWALVFSFIPGAGHMYLGFKDQGLQLMGVFFLSLFAMDWLHMTFVIFLIPIIWFYSMFDALQKASQSPVFENGDVFFVEWLRQNQRLVAYLLMCLGAFLIFNKIALRYFPLQYNENIQTAVVSLLLIGGGIKLLRGTKIDENHHEVEPDFLVETAAQGECTVPPSDSASKHQVPLTSAIPRINDWEKEYLLNDTLDENQDEPEYSQREEEQKNAGQ